MDANKMREQFEAWYVKKFHGGLRDQSTERWLSRDEVSDGYLYRDPQENCEAWKASREAMVVELPSRASEAYRDEFDDVEGGSFNEAAYIRDVRKVIEAAGLKVAP